MHAMTRRPAQAAPRLDPTVALEQDGHKTDRPNDPDFMVEARVLWHGGTAEARFRGKDVAVWRALRIASEVYWEERGFSPPPPSPAD